MDQPIDAWRRSTFTDQELNTPDTTGPLDDPDYDRISNVAEYAFHLDPRTSSTDALPVPMIDANDFLTLEYKRVKSALDISYTPEISTDLVNWNSGPAFLEETRADDPANAGLEISTVRALVPASGAEKQFLRIRLDLQ